MAAVILIINPSKIIPVADALEKAVAPAPVMVYVPDPVMDLVNEPVLANVALVTENVEQASVPWVSVIAPLVVSVPVKVADPAVLTVSAVIVLPLVANVLALLPTRVSVKAVNVPPLDNVRSPATLNAVVGSTNAVVPKLKFLNQLAVVNVWIAVPLAVSDKLGALVAVPPVVPNVNVLVIAAVALNPPVVPVQVNPVASAKLSTVVAAVV